jgi:peptidoglycan biosynthesis protein MviN/MurJ (putative lipid II flippase)
MLKQYARLARPFFVMLAIVTVGRWLMGTVFAVPYDQGTSKMSIVTLTLFASLVSAVFLRRWLGWRLTRAAGFAMFMAVVAQLVVLLSTVAAYALGVPSYFNHPVALNQPGPVGLASALVIRVGGLVANTLLNGIAGSLGWALGGLLPARGEG